MKISRKSLVILPLASLLSLVAITSCEKKGNVNPKDAPAFIEKPYIDFTQGEPNENVFVPSHNTSNGGCFGCIWTKNNISYDEDGMHMAITYDEENDLYYGGEFRSATPDGQFNRGYFGAEIKVAKTVGVATTFFLYTGEYEGNPHDEIDIEFLGKDTTKVQFNYYGGNDQGHEYMYDLGFDASLEYHKYGFFWDYNQIVWYVDGQPVYKVTENIPFHDMRMYTNFWNGSTDPDQSITGWMGAINKNDCPTSCSYKQITYADPNGNGLEVPPGKENESSLDPAKKISLFKNGFESKQNITITKNEDYYDVEFTQTSGSYRHLDPVNFAFMEFGDATFSKVKIKNLDNVSYPLYFMYINASSSSDSEGLANNNGSVKSEKGNSSFVKTHSTSIEFILGAGDTCEFRMDLTPGVTSFSKIQLICDAKTSEIVTHRFQLQDWYIYDNEPSSGGAGGNYDKVNLLNRGFTGSYTVNENEGEYVVSFHQSKGGWSYISPANVTNITVSNPKFVTIKMKNNSDFDYSLAFDFSLNSTNGLTGGGVISSENGKTKYDHHGSTAETFVLGANDTAELRLLTKSTFTNYSKMQLFAAYNNQVEDGIDGSFTLTEWFIAQ